MKTKNNNNDKAQLATPQVGLSCGAWLAIQSGYNNVVNVNLECLEFALNHPEQARAMAQIIRNNLDPQTGKLKTKNCDGSFFDEMVCHQAIQKQE